MPMKLCRFRSCITWNRAPAEYYMNENGIVSWAFNDDAWYDIFFAKRVIITDPDSAEIENFNVLQTGNATLKFNKIGAHKAVLQKYIALTGIIIGEYGSA